MSYLVGSREESVDRKDKDKEEDREERRKLPSGELTREQLARRNSEELSTLLGRWPGWQLEE